VTLDCPPDIAALIRDAARRPMLSSSERCAGPIFGRRQLEVLIPHRDPFLLLDEISHLNRATRTIVCRYELKRGESTLAGHFPGRPLWPGVLQVEAIGQAGLCLVRLDIEGGHSDRPDGVTAGFALTQILGAEFVRPISPPGCIEIVARVLRDGLFTTVIGQCLQHDAPCCAAAVRGIIEEASA
jgi:3-hydroxymyristoyl/3-hydroxydecanoyl-(acyl carrier protein) dehydratase